MLADEESPEKFVWEVSLEIFLLPKKIFHFSTLKFERFLGHLGMARKFIHPWTTSRWQILNLNFPLNFSWHEILPNFPLNFSFSLQIITQTHTHKHCHLNFFLRKIKHYKSMYRDINFKTQKEIVTTFQTTFNLQCAKKYIKKRKKNP